MQVKPAANAADKWGENFHFKCHRSKDALKVACTWLMKGRGSTRLHVAARPIVCSLPVSHSAGALANAHCASRALMLAPSSHVHGTADSDGRAEVTLEHAECDKSLWQVMDLSSCATSAVGGTTSGNRTARHLMIPSTTGASPSSAIDRAS